jgi:hypothetical protein
MGTTKMNYLYLLSRTHFGSAGDGSEATLWHAMNFWIRKGISKKKADFHALEQLIIQSFQASNHTSTTRSKLRSTRSIEASYPNDTQFNR